MMLTNEQLNELTPEQVDQYNQGFDDYCNKTPFNPDWSETRKEGYRDAKEQKQDLILTLLWLANLPGGKVTIECEQSTSE